MDKCTKNLRGNPMNVNFNNSPNFGMAIKLDKSAHLVLKKQCLKKVMKNSGILLIKL